MSAKDLGQSVNELFLERLVLSAGNSSPCQSKHSEYSQKLVFPHGRILRGSPRAMGKVGEILFGLSLQFSKMSIWIASWTEVQCNHFRLLIVYSVVLSLISDA